MSIPTFQRKTLEFTGFCVSIIFSLSSRGFFHIKNTIGDEKYIQIAERIINVLEKEKLIKYEGILENEEEIEENIYID